MCVTALHTVATQVGTNRIMTGGKFHHPFGNPDLPWANEFEWRKQLVRAALQILTMPVDAPTVFSPGDVLA